MAFSYNIRTLFILFHWRKRCTICQSCACACAIWQVLAKRWCSGTTTSHTCSSSCFSCRKLDVSCWTSVSCCLQRLAYFCALTSKYLKNKFLRNFNGIVANEIFDLKEWFSFWMSSMKAFLYKVKWIEMIIWTRRHVINFYRRHLLKSHNNISWWAFIKFYTFYNSFSLLNYS